MHPSGPPPTAFSRPSAYGVALEVAPRLDSWDSADRSSQVGLATFLAHAEAMAIPLMKQADDPLALQLDVALPPSVDLLDERDLDNYAFPLVKHLTQAGNRQFTSVWCNKQHGETSRLSVSTAVLSAHADVLLLPWVTVHTTVSATTPAYKRQIADQLDGQASEIEQGAVSLQLAFTVGPRRNWINLWKATIDSLGLILGRVDDNRPWHPRDGRITELGLHCQVDPDIGNDVLIAIAARGSEPQQF